MAARGLERHTTWYLASDQFAFLTAADDLAHGHVFHDPTLVRLLASPDLPASGTSDALYQTYLLHDGVLFSRYPPGFPLLLTAAGFLGGDAGRHLLNPLLFLALLVVVAWTPYRLLGEAPYRPRAGAGITAAWLLLLIPATLHWWGLTVARDLPAHLLGLLALMAVVGGMVGTAGLLLGFAASIRPDAMLYGVSIAALCLQHRVGRRALVRGLGGLLLGALPLLAYNTVTLGHPFQFTQGTEFRELLGALSPASAFGQTTPVVPSGGGFRLSHLRDTLPVNVAYLRSTFGLFGVVALATLLAAVRRRRTFAVALGPYAVAALLFYSCWGHADPRYLVGLSLCIIVSAAVGVTWWCGARKGTGLVSWRALAGLGVTVVALLASRRGLVGEDASTATVETAVAAGALAARLVAPWLASGTPLLPAIALAVVGTIRVATGDSERDPFQRPQIERARATVEALVPAGSVVLTSPGLGRPAENIAYYTAADAYYLGEIDLLGSTVDEAIRRLHATGRRTFLLLESFEPRPLLGPTLVAGVREVARREGPALRDWFVNARRAPAGAVLYEVTAPDQRVPAIVP